jgi:hypothetical protein
LDYFFFELLILLNFIAKVVEREKSRRSFSSLMRAPWIGCSFGTTFLERKIEIGGPGKARWWQAGKGRKKAQTKWNETKREKKFRKNTRWLEFRVTN